MRYSYPQITDTQPPDPGINSEYINRKYKDWLRRRGLTDPAFAEEYRQMEQRTQLNFRKGSRGSKKK